VSTAPPASGPRCGRRDQAPLLADAPLDLREVGVAKAEARTLGTLEGPSNERPKMNGRKLSGFAMARSR
jgi:hypothetical protein